MSNTPFSPPKGKIFTSVSWLRILSKVLGGATLRKVNTGKDSQSNSSIINKTPVI
ncbi:MAG: hypothetical protein WBF90_15680 [Rivularia sp. (in: cyanobacteria)]